jgi:hypothetical protein
MARDFPDITSAADLLKSMQNQASFQLGAPSPEIIGLLERLELADPNSPDISEDDKNQSWGHCQFSGSSSMLTSWDGIGNTGIACRLIAATIKTCKVARHVCFLNGINATTFLSDAYLSNIIEALWKSWSDTVGNHVRHKILHTHRGAHS